MTINKSESNLLDIYYSETYLSASGLILIRLSAMFWSAYVTRSIGRNKNLQGLNLKLMC